MTKYTEMVEAMDRNAEANRPMLTRIAGIAEAIEADYGCYGLNLAIQEMSRRLFVMAAGAEEECST